jgi:hypothetical protein
MKPVDRGEILGLAEYEAVRPHFRVRVIEEKKRRRVALGPKATATFENRDTVMLQIQEMLRTERITREAAILHEIETYNQLVPGKDEVSCTLMIEIPDHDARDRFLVEARGLERHVALVAGDQRARAMWDPARELEDRTSAVHYLKFPLDPRLADALRRATRNNVEITHVELTVDHPAYTARAVLPADAVLALGEDLAE